MADRELAGQSTEPFEPARKASGVRSVPDGEHAWPYATPVGELPHPPVWLAGLAVVGIVLCGAFGLAVLVADLT